MNPKLKRKPKYDPFARNYAEEEANAKSLDERPKDQVNRRHELSQLAKVHWGSDSFSAAWARHHREWIAKAAELGVDSSREPKSLLVDLTPEGDPLTTHDETIRGDGRLADGTPTWTNVGRQRNLRNLTHLMSVMESVPEGGDIREVDANCNWNWTKGRPFEDADPDTDVVHAIGEKYQHDPVPWDQCRSYPHWPQHTMRGKAKHDAPVSKLV